MNSRRTRTVGSDLALLPLPRDDAKHLEDVLHRLEVIAPIAGQMDETNDAPVLQLAQTGADVGTGNTEGFGDLIGAGGGDPRS